MDRQVPNLPTREEIDRWQGRRFLGGSANAAHIADRLIALIEALARNVLYLHRGHTIWDRACRCDVCSHARSLLPLEKTKKVEDTEDADR